jgi:hypothetical protein
MLMGKLTLTLDDELETRFRDEIYKRLGMKKGNMQVAIEEAIELWSKPFAIGLFPSREAAEKFIEQNKGNIVHLPIQDSRELHPDVKDPTPFILLYRLKNKK